MMRYLMPVLLLLCAACIQLGGEPQPLHYFLLVKSGDNSPVSSSKRLTLALEDIELPSYLDRPQIILLHDGNSVEFKDSERWAEPLKENLTRVLRANLLSAYPAADIAIAPWESSASDALRLKLVINKFTGSLEGQTDIELDWSLSRHAEQLERGRFTDRQPVGSSYQALVSALNQGLDRFSQQLAQRLQHYE